MQYNNCLEASKGKKRKHTYNNDSVSFFISSQGWAQNYISDEPKQNSIQLIKNLIGIAEIVGVHTPILIT